MASAEVEFPGAAPGPMQASVTKGVIRLGNTAIEMAWSIGTNGLRRQSVKDSSGVVTSLSGEDFKIFLTDGTVATSAFPPEGEARIKELPANPDSSRLAGRIRGTCVEVAFRDPSASLAIVWRALGHDGANHLREEIEVTALKDEIVVREIVWFGSPLAGAQAAGQVDGSPTTAGRYFLGFEDPNALNSVEAGGAAGGAPQAGLVNCRLRRDTPLRKGQTLSQSFVLGTAPAGQMRRAFLRYLERERAHPYRPFLHYNSWYDIAWSPFALNETNCLDAIRQFGEKFIRPHGVDMDALVFDDGWDDPKTLWQFHSGFPRGFAPHAALCREYHTRVGVWLSPFGGYGEPREKRLRFGHEQGYETNAAGFSLAGTNYYRAFKSACVRMIREYGANHFKFDGIASGMYASGSGPQYLLDTEAMRRLMNELREEDPRLYINLTTGSWPSPFWLRYADSLWRQGDDMGFSGKGPKQHQWITYRDQETYRNIVRRGPLYPLNSLMTQGVAYSRQGHAGHPEFDAGGFKADVQAFFASGTGLQELYIQPSKLTETDWRVLAEGAKWSRKHAEVLVDTHWLGGDPGKLEVYGWAAWSPRLGIVSLRNPNDQPQVFTLNLKQALELPDGAPLRYGLREVWREDGDREALRVQADVDLRVQLRPFQLLTYEVETVQ